MHSSGRGEEAPEPYSGAVQPTGQPETYGGHVQPAAGTPWGDPAGAPGVAPQPPRQPVEAADATQMLPPYPGAGPAAPPPIPAAPPQAPAQPPAPFAGQAPQPPVQGPFPGQVPPPPAAPFPGQVPQQPAQVAEATQMLPPYPAAGPGEPAPAEATQPLAVYQEQQGFDAYGRPAAPQQFPGQPPYADQAPYPDQQSYGGQQQYTDPAAFEQTAQPDSDYDHLFRNDVPGPEPMRPRIIQPPADRPQPGGHPGQQQWQRGYGGDGYQGYDGYADDEDDGGRRISPKVLIGIVVAGCVIAGLVVGGMMSGGGKANADADTRPSASAPATPSGTASGDGKKAGAGADTAEAQAKALDALLASSGASRNSVVSAVESIRGCKNLPGASADLRSAATQRDGLVSRLGALPVDKLPKHDELTTALTKAWKASSAADGHYAAWADQAANNGSVCKSGHARTTAEAQAGNKESGTATSQKKAAVKLWNSIAATYGLTKRQYSQL